MTNGVVTFSCDDGRAEQFVLMRPILDTYGWAADAYIICDQVDGTGPPTLGGMGAMTVAQCQQLQQVNRWGIRAHASTAAIHDAVGGLTAIATTALLDIEFAAEKKWFHDHDLYGGDFIAYPQGTYNPTVLAHAKRFFTSGRAAGTFAQELYPPGDRMRVRSVVLSSGISLAAVKILVDRAFSYGGWLNVVVHKLGATADSLTWVTSDFASLCAYIAAKPMTVMTVSQVLASRAQGLLASLPTTYAPLPSGTPSVAQVPSVTQVSPLKLGWASASSGDDLAGFWGDQSDGTPSLAGGGALPSFPVSAWCTASGSVYTLTRDCYFATLTVPTGITLKAANFRIYANSVVNNGTIDNSGNNASGATGGTVPAAGTLNQAGVGGNGGTTIGTGGGASAANSYGNVGGKGGDGTGGVGGGAGSAVAPAAVNGSIRTLPQAALGTFLASAVANVRGGSGGGGGGGDSVNAGGAGGSGGSPILIVAKTITNTGTITSNGGNGANGTGGNTGGGGGGGGGVVILTATAITNSGTITASGGNRGIPAGTGTNNAASGSAGNVFMNTFT